MANEPFILIMIMVLLMGSPLPAEGNMDVIFYNNFKSWNKMVMMHCFSNVQDNLPARIFGPTQSFGAFSLLDSGDFTKRNWKGIRYACEFQATGKPTTTLDVFEGTGGSSNQPCGCTGKFCKWTINEEGLTCGWHGYIHKWG